jgi:hypothetical protein
VQLRLLERGSANPSRLFSDMQTRARYVEVLERRRSVNEA